MAYTEPKRVTYTRSVAVTNTTWAIQPPPGTSAGRVMDIQASVTTTYNAVTTSAKVQIGVANNLAVGGVLDLLTTAAGSAVGWFSQFRKGTNPLIPLLDLTGTSNPATISSNYPPAIEALGPVLITFVANTGGTPAGAAVVEVTIDWF